MDLILDIGNTNITIALFIEDKPSHIHRFSSRIEDDVGLYEETFFSFLVGIIEESGHQVKNVIVASVVPLVETLVMRVLEKVTGHTPLLLRNEKIPDLSIQAENIQEIGIDRLINAYAGYKLYKKNLIIIDLGTATTFDVVTRDGIFLGGIIVPGLKLSFDALIRNTGRLPDIKIEPPKSVIGKNTKQCLQSGITFGYTVMVEGLIERIKSELGLPFSVLLTGGLSYIIDDLSDKIDWIEKDLTLLGLHRILTSGQLES